MAQVTTPVMTDATGQMIASAIASISNAPVEQTIEDDGDVTQALLPNVIYHFTGDLTSLTITLTAVTGQTMYHFDFIAGATAPTVTLPNTVVLPDTFSVVANRRYELNIFNGYGVAVSWSIS